MARNIVAVYESYYCAEKAVHELTSNGFPREMIDILNHSRRTQAGQSAEQVKPTAAKPEIRGDGQGIGTQLGAGVGSAIGLAGALLSGTGALQVPFLAQITSSDPWLIALAIAAIATAAGAITGGLLGGIIGLDISETEARQYAKNVRTGEVQVNVIADWDTIDPVIEILTKHNPLEMQEKSIVQQKTDSVRAS